MYTCVCRKVWYSMVYIVLAALAVTPTLQFSVARSITVWPCVHSAVPCGDMGHSQNEANNIRS